LKIEDNGVFNKEQVKRLIMKYINLYYYRVIMLSDGKVV